MHTALVGLAAICALTLSRYAPAQMQVDDFGDGVVGTSGVLVTGVNEGRFDHRVPRALDVDAWVLRTEPGKSYRVRLEIIDSQEEALRWLEPADDGYAFVNPIPGSVWITGDGAEYRLSVRGLAASDSTSKRYQLVVDEQASEPNGEGDTRGTAVRLDVGVWRECTLRASTTTVEAIDWLEFEGTADHRYRLELDGPTTYPTGLIADIVGYQPPIPWGEFSTERTLGDPRVAYFARDNGVFAVSVTGYAGNLRRPTDYRVRIVDLGPRIPDEHGDRPATASPLSMDGPALTGVAFADVYAQGGDDRDWFVINVTAGHAYELWTRRLDASGSVGVLGAAVQGASVERLGAPTVSGTLRPWRFRAREDGDRRLVVGGAGRYEIWARDLGYQADDVGDQFESPATISPGAAITGTLEHLRDVDTFVCTAPAPGAYLPRVFGGVSGGTGYARSTRIEIDGPNGWQSPPSNNYPLNAGEIRLTQGQRLRITILNSPTGGAADLPVTGSPTPYSVQVTFREVPAIPPPGSGPDEAPSTPEGAPVLPVGSMIWVDSQFAGDWDTVLVQLAAGHAYEVPQYVDVRSPSGARVERPWYGADRYFSVNVGGLYALRRSSYGQLGVTDRGVVADDQPSTSGSRRLLVGTNTGRFEYPYDDDRWSLDVSDGQVYRVTAILPATAGVMGWAQSTFEVLPDGRRAHSWPVMPFDAAGFGGRVRVDGQLITQEACDYTLVVEQVDTVHPSSDQLSFEDGGTLIQPGQQVLVTSDNMRDDDAFALDVTAGHVYRFVGINVLHGNTPMSTPPQVYNSDGILNDLGYGPIRALRDERWVVRLGLRGLFVRFWIEDLGVADDDCGVCEREAGHIRAGQTLHGVWERPDDIDVWRIDDEDFERVDVRFYFPNGQLAQYSSRSYAKPWMLQATPLTPYPLSPAPLFPMAYTIRAFRICDSDIASTAARIGADGVRDNNDLILFIDRFFRRFATADVGGPGGTVGRDGVWDNNDFIVFIDGFFSDCS